jgi:predicted RNA binding protein YcfA (HicA-like mRNA interferase family)
MPKLRVLSGDEVVQILLHFGFSVASQKGSREVEASVRER